MIFNQPPLSEDEQIALLESKGLIIRDKAKAKAVLTCISFHRLKAYAYPFQDQTHPSNPFMRGTTLSDVIATYDFDRKLRILVMDAIERIEVTIRTLMVNKLALTYGSHWFQNSDLFKNATDHKNDLGILRRDVRRSSADSIRKYSKQFTSPVLPPAWMTLETVSFGTLSKFYDNLKTTPEKKAIARYLGLPTWVFLENWMKSFNEVRNICAHHNRLWSKVFLITIRLPDRTPYTWLNERNVVRNRSYAVLSSMLYILNIVSPEHTWKRRLLDLLAQYPAVNPVQLMGFPEHWKTEPLWKDKRRIYIGPKGGKFYYNKNGQKTYMRKPKDG